MHWCTVWTLQVRSHYQSMSICFLFYFVFFSSPSDFIFKEVQLCFKETGWKMATDLRMSAQNQRDKNRFYQKALVYMVRKRALQKSVLESFWVCVGNIKPSLSQHSQGRGPYFKLSLPTMHWAPLSRQWKDEARWMTKGENGDLGWARLGRHGRVCVCVCVWVCVFPKPTFSMKNTAGGWTGCWAGESRSLGWKHMHTRRIWV